MIHLFPLIHRYCFFQIIKNQCHQQIGRKIQRQREQRYNFFVLLEPGERISTLVENFLLRVLLKTFTFGQHFIFKIEPEGIYHETIP